MPPRKTTTTLTVTTEPVCGNCRWAVPRQGSTFIQCDVDLPPFVRRLEAPNMQLANVNYSCALHQRRKTA
jgi:hypothetical protein